MTNKISDNNLIKKGDRILLEIEKGHILISQRVRALESGDKGDIIKVKNKNKKIDAEIIGKSKVKLLDD